MVGSSKGSLGITILEHFASTGKAVWKKWTETNLQFLLLFNFPVFQREFWFFAYDEKSNHLTYQNMYMSKCKQITDSTLSRLKRCLKKQLFHKIKQVFTISVNPYFSYIFPVTILYETILTILFLLQSNVLSCFGNSINARLPLQTNAKFIHVLLKLNTFFHKNT